MLFALTIHEASHAYTAYLCGDDTPSLQGRVTLNPFRHIDFLGLLAFFIIHLGWAKPVLINPARMRNPRRDEVLVSLAGPFSNLILGAIIAIILRLSFKKIISLQGSWDLIFFNFLNIGAQLNAGLAFFNLLPVPPLDGSHFVSKLLPYHSARRYEQMGGYGMLILLMILVSSSLIGFDILRILIGVPSRAWLGLFMGRELTGIIFRESIFH